MPKGISLYLGQVAETLDPTQFNQGYKDPGTDEELKPGAIRVRSRIQGGRDSEEVWAYPMNFNLLQVPLYGEQVMVIKAINGEGEAHMKERFYYLPFTLGAHSLVNANIMPFVHDATIQDVDYTDNGISIINPGEPPTQLSFQEKDVVAIQPYQGDTIIQSRFGSLLRFSSTHAELDSYKEKPFWSGGAVGSPFISLTCDVKGASTGDVNNDFYKIEEPNNDSSFIYLTSTQKLGRLNVSQGKLGEGVTGGYQQPQVVIGANRLIFNAKSDEIILVSAKDVKVSVPDWATDMNNFFTLVFDLITELDKIVNTKETIATGAGPTGIATNAAKFTDILNRMKAMKQ